MAQSHKDFEDAIKNNEKNIKSFKEEIKSGMRDKAEEIAGLKNEIQENKERIESIEKELKERRGNENSLEDKIKSLEKEIKDLKKENEMLVKRLQEMKEKTEEIEKCKIQEGSVFIIMQIGTSIQRNMCEYVLGKHFKEDLFYKFKDIDKYISDLNRTDQESPTKRLDELKEKISWDQRLLDSLKNLNHMRIGIAHPQLSSERIQRATEYLKKEKILSDGMENNINKLKVLWGTSEALLQTRSTEGQDIGSSRNPSTTGQKHDTPNATAGKTTSSGVGGGGVGSRPISFKV